MKTIACQIFRCSKQQEMYLYLRDGLDIEDVPDELRKRLGRLEEVMQLELHPQRTLARVAVDDVIQSLQDKGFFLQMPPQGQVQTFLYQGD